MIFDAHGDIMTDIWQEHQKGNKDSFKKRHLDLYNKGGVTHSIFVNWTDPKDKNKNTFDNIFEEAMIELNNSDIFQICTTHHDMIQSLSKQKIGIILGIEGLKNLKDIKHLNELYNLGVRHASLTWNEANKYAHGLDNNTRGLTKKGFELIKEMERLGMIIDLAHTNKYTFSDIMENTTKPVIISHGNTKALCDHRRNYTDKQLQQIKDKNGVIGICAIPPFVGKKPQDQNISYMAKHIEYVRDLIGIKHVGLGFDLCYYLNEGVSVNNLDGLATMENAKDIIIELQKLEFTDQEIELVTHGNFERVIKEILG